MQTIRIILSAIRSYLERVFSACSQALNTVFLFGDPNESICGRCYRQSWILPMRVLDLLLAPFSKGHHCRGAYNQDRAWAINASQWPDRVEKSEAALKG